jgi:hypothetical protein
VTPSGPEKSKTVSPADYIQENFRPSDRVAILLRNRANTVQRILSAARITEPSFEEWLRYKNDKELYDIYVGMNALKPGARTRTKEDIHAVRHLYLDLDHDGPAALARIRELLFRVGPGLSVRGNDPDPTAGFLPCGMAVLWPVNLCERCHLGQTHDELLRLARVAALIVAGTSTVYAFGLQPVLTPLLGWPLVDAARPVGRLNDVGSTPWADRVRHQ